MSVIWFTIRYRLDEIFEVKSIVVQEEDTPAVIKENIMKAFKQAPNPKLDFKVRNIKGVICPLNSLIPRNTKLKPYVVQLFVPRVRVVSAHSIKTDPSVQEVTKN
jgi:hypothetical protein